MEGEGEGEGGETESRKRDWGMTGELEGGRNVARSNIQ